MVAGRGKAQSTARMATGSSKRIAARSTRSNRAQETSNMYDDMLAEAALIDPEPDRSRPPKRRRLATPRVEEGSSPVRTGDESSTSGHKVQTVEDSESDDSDVEFEDVDLDSSYQDKTGPNDGDIEDVSVPELVAATSSTNVPTKRRPLAAAEKAQRLVSHKAHVLCLLAHGIYANSWCNNDTVHECLLRLVGPQARTWLTLGSENSQFERNRWFMHGLETVAETFRTSFTVTASGITRPKWPGEGNSQYAHDVDELRDRSGFVVAAKRLEGSQDVGNQLFCALLRAIGVETRLVFSLQPIPFGIAASISASPQKPSPYVSRTVVPITAYGESEMSANDSAVSSSRRIGKVPSVRRRLGQPSFVPENHQRSPAQKKKEKKIQKLNYPVFWVEAFNLAHQKWIPVDPVVTKAVNKAAQLEPPISYPLNQLSYAIAFESDGVARDVTRRYAKSYNAKTRRQRVESTENGQEWYRKAIQFFRRRSLKLDRDQVEDAELAQKEAKESMPTNIQYFKDHPYYALERHIRRHEVIHPRREVGKANAGTNAKPRMEPVFRRQDVLVCRNADKWYRLGRVVKPSEQPLKYIAARKIRKIDDNDERESAVTTGLYAAFQTDLYVPPPVVRGRIPRNAYGNIDIYMPSMVPVGGTHIRHHLTRQAAQILKVDCVDAVTGFSFKGRRGTAVVDGAVVASRHADAVLAVLDGFGDVQQEEASMARSETALKCWRRLLTALRVRERVREYGSQDHSSGESSKEFGNESPDTSSGLDRDGDNNTPLLTAGKFALAELSLKSKPREKRPRKRLTSEDSELDGSHGEESEGPGYPNEDGRSGGFIAVDEDDGQDVLHTADHGHIGGGFLSETLDVDDNEGGFIHDVESDHAHSSKVRKLSSQHSTDISLTPVKTADELPGDEIEAAPVEDPHVEHGETTAHQNAGSSKHPQAATMTPESEGVANIQRTTSMSSPSPSSEIMTDDEKSDPGSLLSHDPEDDDAEPDWLESD